VESTRVGISFVVEWQRLGNSPMSSDSRTCEKGLEVIWKAEEASSGC
jgi:hypothetical protein